MRTGLEKSAGASALVGGLIAGAARPYYCGPGLSYYCPSYYYGPSYYYDSPTYDYRSRYYRSPAPVYIDRLAVYAPRGPNGPLRQCWVSTDPTRGYGYWRPC